MSDLLDEPIGDPDGRAEPAAPAGQRPRRPVMPPDPGGLGRPGASGKLSGDLRQRPNPLARRRRIRQAAARLFAEHGASAIGLERVAEAAELDRKVPQRLFGGRHILLAELLSEHLEALNAAICAAHDAHAAHAPEARLEALVRAYLDAVAAAPNEHRTFLFCAHLVMAQRREAVLLRHSLILETVAAELGLAVPALADRPEAAEPLLATVRALLDDRSCWPSPPEPEARRRHARRIAGMLLAAARAEAAGDWPALGTARPPLARPGRLQVDCRQARARLRELLDAAIAGAEVVITRQGRPAARVVGCGDGG